MDRVTQYIRVHEVLSRVLRNPALRKHVTLESVIQYTTDFIAAVGAQDLFQDKEATLEIEDFRALLPCDCVAVLQVRDEHTGICMRSMTGSFTPQPHEHRHDCCHPHHHPPYPINDRHRHDNHTFKIQNSVIVCSFPKGKIRVAYKAIVVDEDGYPMVQDNPTYLKALELYIKKEVFTELMESGKLDLRIVQHAESEYYTKVSQLEEEMNTPSDSEMTSLINMWNTLIPRTTEFDNGYKSLGNREYLRRH